MNIWKRIEDFLAFKSENSRRTYRSSVRDWLKSLGVEMATGTALTSNLDRDAQVFEQAGPAQALAYLSGLRNREGQLGTKISDATIALRCAALHSIYRFLVDTEAVAKNPFVAVRNLLPARCRVEKRPTKLIPLGSVRSLLHASVCQSKHPGHRKAWVRNRAFVWLLFGGGLRRSEALNLPVDSVGVTPRGELYLELGKTKSGKRQQQPLPKWAWSAYSALVSQRKQEGAFDKDPLFVTYRRDGSVRGKASVETMYRMYKREVRRELGLDAAPHSARATYATKLKAQGVDDREVARALRHTTTAQVEVYHKRSSLTENHAGVKLRF